jgi:2-keto-4-pentenoate hydratase/2-oxohepta-3-ene-1,7-dioic acid hydratase in catechol pathway
MANFKLASYQAAAGPRAGVVIDDRVLDAAALTGRPGYATMLGILADWDAAQDAIEAAAARGNTGDARPLDGTKLLAPVLWPSAIYCAGANYGDHMAEMARVQNIAPEPDPRSRGLKPWHFIKASRSIIESGAIVKLPAYSQMVDWEAELAGVIGRTARNVSVERALDHVAGYTVANDLSARDAGRRPHISDTSPFKFDWVGQKSFDGACPLGPWLVPARQIADPQKLGIKLWINDAIKQDSNTTQMIFSLAEQIAYLSTRITLYPGDLILTGTPAGVGMARKEFLKAGDVVKVWVEDVGTLVNTCA